MIKTSSILVLLLFLIACDEELDSQRSFVDPNPFDVELKINNKSNFVLDSFYVESGSSAVYFGSVKSKELSPFKSFQIAYEEMGIKFKVDKNQFAHIPPTTSTKLENGRYELQIDKLDTSALSFTFLLEKLE